MLWNPLPNIQQRKILRGKDICMMGTCVFPANIYDVLILGAGLQKGLQDLWDEAIMASAFIIILALMDAESRVGFTKPARALAFISLLYFF